MKSLILLFTIFTITSGNAGEYRVGIILKKEGKGETEFAKRLQIAARNLNWSAEVYDFRETLKGNFDMVLNMSRHPVHHPNCKNYLVLFDTLNACQGNTELRPDFLSYDAYLCTIKNVTAQPQIKWYPTVQSTDYMEVQPNNLMYLINPFHLKTKYLEILHLLDQTGYCAFFGNKSSALQFPGSYRGVIPYNGVQLLKVFREKGIALVIHRTHHNNLGIPSGRIFEAAASSCTIICDKNQFVIERFGESVLYFDHDADAPTIFTQIDAHMQWIRDNPEEALAKAKQAHTIFSENFTLENQLKELERIHEELLHRGALNADLTAQLLSDTPEDVDEVEQFVHFGI